MKLSDDKTVLNIKLDCNFSPSEVETLIAHLGVWRSKMNPAISSNPPTKNDEHSANLSVQTDPVFAIGRQSDGNVRAWFRNEGLGWLVFVIPADKAGLIRDLWINATAGDDEPGTRDLFSEDFSGGQTH